MPRLILANAVFVSLLVIHVADHAIRHDSAVPGPLASVGLAANAVAVGVLVLALVRHRLAPAASVAMGFGTALGFVMAHVVPEWSGAFSQPYADLDVDALSWAIVGACVVAGLVVGVAGLSAARAPGVRDRHDAVNAT